jgi:hypothetical protein
MTVKKGKKLGRRFRGIWIPSAIWLDKGLSGQEKIFLAEIDSLDNDDKGCRASNSYLAEFFSISPKRVSVVINKLIEKHRVSVSIDKGAGNIRYLRVLSPETGIALSPEAGIAYPLKHGDPIPGTGDRLNKDDNKGDNKGEREAPTPILSESEEICKLKIMALAGNGLGREDAARFAYLNSKSDCMGLGVGFFEFFETEVIGRFDKFKVTPVVLKDWAKQLCEKYGREIAAAAMSDYSAAASGWAPKLTQVLAIAKRLCGEQRKQERDQKEAAERAEAAKRLLEKPTRLNIPLCDRTDEQLAAAMIEYQEQANNFMISRIEKEQEKRKQGQKAQCML